MARYFTSVGPRGTMTVYFDDAARNNIASFIGQRGEGDAVKVTLSVHKAGHVSIFKNPDQLKGWQAERVVTRQLTKRPDEKFWHVCVGYMHEKWPDLTLEAIGGVWNRSEVKVLSETNDTISLGAPSKTPMLVAAPKTRTRKRAKKGTLFLGTFPDGSPISFRLTMSNTMELADWLRSKGVDIDYEEKAGA